MEERIPQSGWPGGTGRSIEPIAQVDRFMAQEDVPWEDVADGLFLVLKGEVQAPTERLGRLETCLADSATAKRIQDRLELCCEHSMLGDDVPDVNRLQGNALALVLAAKAAGLIRSRDPAMLREAVAVASRIEELLGGTPLFLPPGMDATWASCKEHWMRTAQSFEAAVLWIDYWLSDHEAPFRHRPTRQTAVAGLQEGAGSASLLRLAVARTDDNNVRAIEHPDMALVPVTPALLGAASAAANASGIGVAWRLSIRDPQNQQQSHRLGPLEVLKGPSAGAAFRIGAACLVSGDDLDQGVFVTAAVTDNNHLKPVGGEFTKLQAARAASFSIGIVAGRPSEAPNRLTLEQKSTLGTPDGSGRSLQTCECATVDDAVRLMTDRAALIGHYLRRLSSQGSVAETVAQLAGKALHGETGVYVNIEVRTEQGQRDAEGGRAGDRDEAAFVPWPTAFERFKQGDRSLLVLEGDAGVGKSEAFRLVLRAQAEDSVRSLPHTPPDAVVLPFFIKCGAVKQGLAPKDGATPDPEEALLRLMERELLIGRDPQPAADQLDRLRSYLRAQLEHQSEEPRIWLMLDGLDEGDFGAAVRDVLAAVTRRPAVRVLVSTRKQATSQLDRFTAQRVLFAARGFGADEQKDFIGRWFSPGEPPAGLREQVGPGGALNDLATVPVLLTFVCWLAERRGLGRLSTRVELYRDVISMLLLTERPGQDWAAPSAAQMELACDYLSDIWYARFEEWEANGEALKRSLLRSDLQERYGDAAGQAVVDELERRRMWSQDGEGDARFCHRSLGEFLCGLGLARKMRGLSVAERQALMAKALPRDSWNLAVKMAVSAFSLLLGKRDEAGELIRALAEHSATGTIEAATLLGNAVADGGEKCVPKADREWLALELLHHLRNGQEARKRAAAGDALARVGDPRFEGFESDLVLNDPRFERLRQEPEYGSDQRKWRETLKGTPWKLPVFMPDLEVVEGHTHPQVTREPSLGFIFIEEGPFWMGSTLPEEKRRPTGKK